MKTQHLKISVAKEYAKHNVVSAWQACLRKRRLRRNINGRRVQFNYCFIQQHESTQRANVSARYELSRVR